MGNWFTNLHVRKNENVDIDAVVAYITGMMAAKNYIPVEIGEYTDIEFAIMTSASSDWVSILSNASLFDGVIMFDDIAGPMSRQLNTDVLEIACFDSDYVFLHLINAVENIDAWAGAGNADAYDIPMHMDIDAWAGAENADAYDIPPRMDIDAWRDRVNDIEGFKAAIKKEYVFAEDALAEMRDIIRLPPEHSMASYDYIDDMANECDTPPVCLYFRLADSE